MYVIVAVAVLLIAGLLYLLDRALKAVNEGRRRREAALRLAAAAAEAEEKDRQRRAAAAASAALTTVLPAILEPERDPRRVA
ncbi:MAG TPA: hypothetical protein VKV38_06125 [Trebonia sp.]|jgi:hypothetical protein|nr:hypothetical protein [Trebonia sp.]